MGIFDRFRKKKMKNKKGAGEDLAKDFCKLALKFAEDVNKKLDYSKNSIAVLEEVLDCYSNDIPKSKPTENQIRSMSVIFGSYLGEIMLQSGLSEAGFFWETDGSPNTLVLVKSDGSYLTPCNKVYKRLVNGIEDNVIAFYKFAMEEFTAQK